MILLWWPACLRPLPDHLRVEAPRPIPGASAPVTAPVDRATALSAVIGADPLARRPAWLDAAGARSIPDAGATADFLDAVLRLETTRDAAGPLRRVEEGHLGTEAVGLSRGLRLAQAEGQLHSTLVDATAAQRAAVGLVTPLGEPEDALGDGPLLAFSGGPEGLGAHAGRWVLAGWLDGPEVPLAPVAAALRSPAFDPWRDSPLGQLIVARAEGRAADPTSAWADLERATHLALVRAAADRDAEQGAWADEKRRVAEELGANDPIAALLARAFDGLTADAGAARSAGGALLAATALRLLDRCPDAPCRGLDRATTLRRAASWDPAVASLAATWEVVSWDKTLATMAAGRDTGLFPDALVDLADGLAALGSVDGALLSHTGPDPGVWLLAGRAVGIDGCTGYGDAAVALGKRHQELARSAARTAPSADAALLERIASRAVP